MHKQADKAINDPSRIGYLDSPSKIAPGRVPQTPNNIFQSILSSGLSAAEKQQNRIAQEGFVVLVAGGETTARVLATATYHLLANQDSVLLRLKDELANAMEDPNMRPDVRTLEQLPWLVRPSHAQLQRF